MAVTIAPEHEETASLRHEGVWHLAALDARDPELAALGRDVSAALEELARITSSLSVGVTRSSLAVDVISESVRGLREQLVEVAARVSSLRDSSEEAASSAQESAGLATELAQESERGLGVVGDVIDAIGDVSEQTATVHELVEALAGNELTAIGRFSAVIDRIADQTKLLALNAAIEAARAGEHGRGFAVVADEVGRLASEAAQHTAQIRETVQHTQQQMKRVQEAASAARERSAQGAQDAGTGRSALERIGSMVTQSEAGAGVIASLASSQLADVGVISDGMASITEHSVAIESQSTSVAAQQMALSMGTSAASQTLGRFDTGGLVSRLRTATEEVAAELGAILDGAVQRRKATLDQILDPRYQEATGHLIQRFARLFDVSRADPAGFTPPKYYTAYDAHVDEAMTECVDRLMAAEPKLTFVLPLDLNSYAPAHNAKYTKDITGDPAVDLVGNRSKRFFEGGALMRASRMDLGVDLGLERMPRAEMASRGARLTQPEGGRPFLLQTYARDTGAVLSNLSVPIYVGGQRWGALSVAWDPEQLTR